MNFSRDQNPFAILARLFGRAVPEPPKAGTAPTGDRCEPRGCAWRERWRRSRSRAPRAAATGTSCRPRRVGARRSRSAGRARVRRPARNVIQYDPQQRCIQQVGTSDPILLNTCLAQQLASPTTDIAGDIADRRRAGLPHSADDVDQLRHRLQPHAEVGGALDDDVRRRAPPVRQPHRLSCSANCTTGARSSASRNRRTATSRSTSRSR